MIVVNTGHFLQKQKDWQKSAARTLKESKDPCKRLSLIQETGNTCRLDFRIADQRLLLRHFPSNVLNKSPYSRYPMPVYNCMLYGWGERQVTHFFSSQIFRPKRPLLKKASLRALPLTRPDLHGKVLDLKLMSQQEETLGGLREETGHFASGRAINGKTSPEGRLYLKNSHKLFDTSTNKQWSLCPLLMSLDRFLTT